MIGGKNNFSTLFGVSLMCGIAGLFDVSLASHTSDLRHTARKMASALEHRGPDDQGIFIDADAGIAFAHRRLAILDLSEAGHQPMMSSSGRFVVVYNGEIYNTEEMRRHPHLSNVNWRGRSDTEVILESIERRGLDCTLSEMNGMFSFALWDRRENSLNLVRDRMGIKPLFFSRSGKKFIFGSEVRALVEAGLERNIDPRSVATFLRFGYVPAPFGIYVGLEKVMPGQVVTIDCNGVLSSKKYWSLSDAIKRNQSYIYDASDKEATDALETLLVDAVSRQAISDVPLGAFLSGGIDSSTVVALMAARENSRVQTFSIGFPELGFDESPYAAAIGRHLGTQHTCLSCTASEALAVVPFMADIYDEPFADSSQIPTYLVSALTRQSVKVALSGDGGDELFAGYNRYMMAGRYWRRIELIPKFLRSYAGELVAKVPPTMTDALIGWLPGMPPLAGDKLAKAASVFGLDADELYHRLVCQVPDPWSHLASAEHPGQVNIPEGLSLLDYMRFNDMMTYLPDDILQKVDRASMAVSLEARPPFLDHRVVEFAWCLPERLLIRNGRSKWLLREVLERYVPSSLLERPKMGFGVPLAQWLRGPLRTWAADLLEARDYGGGILSPDVARRLWSEHLSCHRNHAYQLWTLLMFEAWRRRWSY